MEDYLGRPLEADECVHHVDENRLNNSLDNLELCMLSVHSRYHMKKNHPRKGRILTKHGTVWRYKKHGCRCDLCTEAKRLDMQNYRKGR